MSYRRDTQTHKINQRISQLEEENRQLKEEQNKLISTLLLQLNELQEQNKQILNNNRTSDSILVQLNQICGTNHLNIDLLLIDINHKFQDYQQQLQLLTRTCKQYEEIVLQQNKLKEKSLKSTSSKNFVYFSKRQSVDSLSNDIKLESSLLEEEHQLLELLEIPINNNLCLKIDQLGQQIIDKLRDYSQKRDNKLKLIEQLIAIKQGLQ